MKKLTLLLLSSAFLTSCYSYQTFEEEIQEVTEISVEEVKRVKAENIRKSNATTTQLNLADSDQQPKVASTEKSTKDIIRKHGNAKANLDEQVKKVPETTKSIIKEKGYYQVNVFEKTYKMEADKWQGDTIVGHVKGKPNQVLKFHEKDIQDLKIRKFSKGRSDALTVAAYATAGVGLFLLLK